MSEAQGTAVVSKKEGELTGAPSRVLRFGDSKQIDVSHLNEEQIQQLQLEHGKAMININTEVAKKQIDLQSMTTKFDTMNATVRDAGKEGLSATITNVQTDGLGRTETIIGNTDAARGGKLSDRQAGVMDRNLVYLGIGAAVLIVIAIILGGG
jgi:hypothetical protein